MNSPLSLKPLRQAHCALAEALEQTEKAPEHELMRDGLIQRFEFTYEMAWKTMKRYLETEHQEAGADQWSRRDLYRIAGETGLIDDPKAWFEFMKLRNLSSHTYNKAAEERVATAIPGFAAACEVLINTLADRLADASPN